MQKDCQFSQKTELNEPSKRKVNKLKTNSNFLSTQLTVFSFRISWALTRRKKQKFYARFREKRKVFCTILMVPLS